jgi:dTDP-4-amino-4,6-dideoxygalactose transaminase
MKIPYGRHFISDEDVEAVEHVLKGDWLTTGPFVNQFESLVAQVSGASFASVVTSGTAALHTAYAAVGIGSGDQVVTTPMTFSSTAATAIQLGASIKFADIDLATGLIDPSNVASLTNSKTKAITTVDYAGNPSPVDIIRELIAPNEIIIIQDAAHSIGGFDKGRPIGSIADITTFSFFPTKNITTAEGGAVVTNSEQFHRAAQLFKSQGIERDRNKCKSYDGPWFYEVQNLGLNYRLPDVLCALGISQIQQLEVFKQRRTELRSQYIAAFEGITDIRHIKNVKDSDPMWHLFPMFVDSKRRKRIFEQLQAQDIAVQVNYIPVYWHPYFQELGYKRGQCPNAEKFYSEEISLPLYYGLTDEQQSYIIDSVIESVTG